MQSLVVLSSRQGDLKIAHSPPSQSIFKRSMALPSATQSAPITSTESSPAGVSCPRVESLLESKSNLPFVSATAQRCALTRNPTVFFSSHENAAGFGSYACTCELGNRTEHRTEKTPMFAPISTMVVGRKPRGSENTL